MDVVVDLDRDIGIDRDVGTDRDIDHTWTQKYVEC